MQSDTQADGAVVGSFSDYDGLVSALRARISAVGLSHSVLEELAGWCEGSATKYIGDLHTKHFSVKSLLQVTEANRGSPDPRHR